MITRLYAACPTCSRVSRFSLPRSISAQTMGLHMAIVHCYAEKGGCDQAFVAYVQAKFEVKKCARIEGEANTGFLHKHELAEARAAFDEDHIADAAADARDMAEEQTT